GPVLLAHDIDERILVLTDLGDSNTLSDTLVKADDEERLQVIRALGTELGQMHADTAGREPDFEALANRVIRNQPDIINYQLRAEALHNSIYLGLEILKRAGLTPPEAVSSYANASAATLLSGNERAFTPFDLSPDKIGRASWRERVKIIGEDNADKQTNSGCILKNNYQAKEKMK